MRGSNENALQDLGAAVREGEAALKVGSSERSGNGQEWRAKMQAAIDKATAACQRLQEKSVAAAKATDKAVREHPYQAVGVAFGVGLLIGVLAMRWRNRD